MVGLFYQIMAVARSSPSRSWVDCTTITKEVLEFFYGREEAGS
jgi:hypothetical protein